MMLMRRRHLILGATLLIALWMAPFTVHAHHKPGHGGPTTTTVAPTTTTVAPTTTTVAPTTTTVVGCSPGTPTTITSGGTYTGCYESLDPNVPAVTLNTTQPVTLSRATIRHEGQGIAGNTQATNLTVTDTLFQALDNGGTFLQQAINLHTPASLVVEHNSLIDGQAIRARGVGGTVGTLVVRYNEARNVGRYPHPTTQGCCVQFLSISDVLAPGADVAWNRVTNVYGQSNIEDHINTWSSSGTSTAPMTIHDNLLDGAFPRTGNGAGFTGGGALAGDSEAGGNGDYIHITGNRAVNVANYGVYISGGAHNRVQGNRVVADRTADAAGTIVMSDFAQAGGSWCWQLGGGCPQGSDNDLENNVLGLERRDGSRNDWWTPTCSTDTTSSCAGNEHFAPTDITPAHEQAERDAWAAAAAAAGVTVGPRP